MQNLAEIKKFCEECGKHIELKTQRDIVRKRFCSRQCNGAFQGRLRFADPVFKAKFLAAGQTLEANAHKGKKGEDSTNWKGGKVIRRCLWCSKEFKTAPHRITAGNGKYCSRKCCRLHWANGGRKKVLVPFVCQGCGKTAFECPFWAKRRKFCSRRCTGIHAAQVVSSRVGPTWIERAVEMMLIALKVPYETQKPMLGLTLVDFFVPPDLVIYTDGTYWHSTPKRKHQDAWITRRLLEAGYRVLRIPEAQLQENIEGVRRIITEDIHAKCQHKPEEAIRDGSSPAEG